MIAEKRTFFFSFLFLDAKLACCRNKPLHKRVSSLSGNRKQPRGLYAALLLDLAQANFWQMQWHAALQR